MAKSSDQKEDDTDPWIKELENGEVFVMYKNEDEYEISKYIFSIFDKMKVRYVSPEEIMPGFRTLQAVHQAVETSKKMLLIMSKESIEQFSFSLETLFALEKSIQTNKLSLIILLKDGLKETDIPKLPMLQSASHVILQINLYEKCVERVIEMIRADVTMDAVLPAGNLAAGMAWSHFTGYLELVLPELAQGIRKSNWFNDNPGHMPICLFMLLPFSGCSTNTIGDNDPNVEEVGEIPIIIGRRPMSPKVVKVTEKDKNGHVKNEYYCVAQYPGAFCALGTIQKEIISSLPKNQRDVEVQRFNHYLGEILNHENNKQYGRITRMLMYDDEDKSEKGTVSYQLRKGIQDVIKEQLAKPGDDLIQKEKAEEKFMDEVCLLFHKDDEKIVFKVKDELSKNRIRFSIARPNCTKEGDSLRVIEQRVRDAHWVLLFVTENSKSDNMIDLFLAELLSIGVEDNRLKVIPILKDVSPTDLPSFIRWARHISIDDNQHYLQMIMEAIKGREITMSSQIPVGNVANGLAWGFFVNYLKHVLPDFRERVKKCMAETSDIRKYREQSHRNLIVSGQMWEIVPKSCQHKSNLNEVDPDIKGPWKVMDIERKLGGTRRVFPCDLWRISTKDTDYFFAAEYLTPVRTLYNMHIKMIAGLSYEQMMQQRQALVDYLNSILVTASRKDQYQEKCGLIQYDEKEALSSVIISNINKETGHRGEHERFLKFLEKDEQ